MPSLHLSDRLIWFAHCPKAGGTSVETFMVGQWGEGVGHLHWGWDLWWKDGGWRVAEPPNSPQHLIWEDAVRLLPQPPDQVFALVRDPVARMVSEYRWQWQRRRGTRLGRLLAYLPFSIWLRLMLALAQRSPYAYDNHLRPQSDFIPKGAKVFHLEDGMEAVIDWLTSVAGAHPQKMPAPHAIPTSARQDPAPADVARIVRAFERDYARFGYPRPSPAYRADLYDWCAAKLAPLLGYLDRRGAL